VGGITGFLPVPAVGLVLFVADPRRRRYFFLSFTVAGVGLLAKEFAGMIFAGLLVATFLVRMEKKARMILTACLLFVMPAFLYSVAISCVTGKVVILSAQRIGCSESQTCGGPGHDFP